MIAWLSGTVVDRDAEEAVLETGGVGYLVRCGVRTLAALPSTGAAASLFIESQFSADAGPRLYGFLDREDRAAFRILQGVQGVGPKAALAVLDVLPPPDLAAAVLAEDKAKVAQANGVGPKLALRIITELKGKALSAAPSIARPLPEPVQASTAGEAVLALLGLGIAEPLARRAVERAEDRAPGADLPALIKAALQEVSR